MIWCEKRRISPIQTDGQPLWATGWVVVSRHWGGSLQAITWLSFPVKSGHNWLFWWVCSACHERSILSFKLHQQATEKVLKMKDPMWRLRKDTKGSQPMDGFPVHSGQNWIDHIVLRSLATETKIEKSQNKKLQPNWILYPAIYKFSERKGFRCFSRRCLVLSLWSALWTPEALGALLRRRW